jgi:hypothetical protein
MELLPHSRDGSLQQFAPHMKPAFARQTCQSSHRITFAHSLSPRRLEDETDSADGVQCQVSTCLAGCFIVGQESGPFSGQCKGDRSSFTCFQPEPRSDLTIGRRLDAH